MDNQKPKLTPWNKIKKLYLEGVSPKELEALYGYPAKDIGDKASKEGWAAKKREIAGKIEQTVQQRIEGLTSKALNALEDVLDTSDDDKDKIAAARAVIDISGLKAVKNIVSADAGFSLFIEKAKAKAEKLEKELK